MGVIQTLLNYLPMIFYFTLLIPLLYYAHLRIARLTPEQRKRENDAFKRERDWY